LRGFEAFLVLVELMGSERLLRGVDGSNLLRRHRRDGHGGVLSAVYAQQLRQQALPMFGYSFEQVQLLSASATAAVKVAFAADFPKS